MHKLAIGLLTVLLINGCAVRPGLRAVNPYWNELNSAAVEIRTASLDEPRNLPGDQWRPTLHRVVAKIRPAAAKVCKDVGAKNCDEVNRSVSLLPRTPINAFVDKHHNVSFYAGLVAKAGSDEELGAVLAHEYGHIFAGHIRKSQANAAKGALLGALVGATVDAATGTRGATDRLSKAGEQAGYLAYSKGYELEADYYSALILQRAGIDLKHGKNLMIRLARVTQGPSITDSGMWGAKASLMATTHPSDSMRVGRWMAVSRSIEESVRLTELDSTIGDEQLRQLALKRLMDKNSIGDQTRWLNHKNGQSGTLTLKKMKAGKDLETCLMIEQADFFQGKATRTKLRICD